MKRAKLTVRYHDDVYTVDYWPDFAGNYHEPPESAEIEIVAVNGHPDTTSLNSLSEDAYIDLQETLLKLAEDQIAAYESLASDQRQR